MAHHARSLLILLATTCVLVFAAADYRHYFFYASAPQNASAVRNTLFTQWNALYPTQHVVANISSFADPADAGDPKYPYNWGGYFQLANRTAWQAYDSWQKTQPAYVSTFAPLTDVTRFHAIV